MKGGVEVKITTKRGDKGYTDLLFSTRVPKYDLRPDTYGTIDEANSALGLARSIARREKVQEVLHRIQEELFVVGAELATSPEDTARLPRRITPQDTQRLEALMEEIEREIDMPQGFVIPGSMPSSAALDVARTIIRRAERGVARMRADALLADEEILIYLNRLSDLLYTLARYEEGGEYDYFDLKRLNGATQ
ncbi:MAG: cob(I)yrinic acid a,c-diamide adenosyltransferase [Candidatus Tectomicrobia bacterium]|uniref:Corrinoid adenosyltransferase n=1 Tax=Tectimicrobiota bacterium TaxID=2528274 RepID=A0A932CPK7_UNCTE|nr:cob(I)yrinic acid a,c-diamide adenosyltransferase [Candidatus Tectomicrobia bacterium]